MDTISISTLAILAGKWQAEADAHVTSPSTYGTARRETLRECADVLRGLRSQGTTIILITHKLKEVMGLCDQVTVMRGGRVVQELPIAQASIEKLAEAMVGRKVNMGRMEGDARQAGEVLLQARQVALHDAMQVQRLADFIYPRRGACHDRAG